MRIAGRPFGIIVLALLALAGGLWAISGVAGLHGLDEYTLKGIDIPANVVRLVVAAWAVALLAGGVFLLALHRWGWVLLMLATGAGLAASLWQWWLGNPESIRLAILVVTAFYLNAHEVRDLLLRPAERTQVVPLAPQEGGRP